MNQDALEIAAPREHFGVEKNQAAANEGRGEMGPERRPNADLDSSSGELGKHYLAGAAAGCERYLPGWTKNSGSLISGLNLASRPFM